MALKEKAIDAYNKRKIQTEAENLQEAENFYEGALKALKERLGDNYANIQVLKKDIGDTIFDVDGIRMGVAKSQGYYDIYIIQKCQKCGEEFSKNITSLNDPEKVLEDIGKILQGKHDEYDCNKFLEAKQPKKEPTTEEKLLDAFKQFILGEFAG